MTLFGLVVAAVALTDALSAPPAYLSSSTVAELVDGIRSDDRATRGRTQNEIIEHGRAAVPVLVELLRSEDPFWREWAADRLGELNATEAIPALVRALEHPSNAPKTMKMLESEAESYVLTSYRDRDVQTALLQAIWRLGPEAEVPLRRMLVQAKIDADRRRIEAARLGLSLIGVTPPGGSPDNSDERVDVGE